MISSQPRACLRGQLCTLGSSGLLKNGASQLPDNCAEILNVIEAQIVKLHSEAHVYDIRPSITWISPSRLSSEQAAWFLIASLLAVWLIDLVRIDVSAV